MSVTLEIFVDKDKNGNPVRRVPAAYTNKHPMLHTSDTLAVKKGNGWGSGDGFTKLKFYHGRTNYDNDTSFAEWTPGVNAIADVGKI